MAFQTAPLTLGAAQARFNEPANVVIRQLEKPNPMTEAQCIPALGNWLKSWRQHGRSPNLALNQPGFDYARRDHKEGVKRLTGHVVTSILPEHAPKGNHGDVFRAALGIPIVQFFGSQPRGQPNKVNWDWHWNAQKRKGEGRFASPVLLRPHKDAKGDWHALVIFVDAHRWPANKKVFLDKQPRDVSLALFETMKTDRRLRTFP